MDPQFSRTGNNMMTAQDGFDRLIDNDANLQTRPALALSWKTIDPLTWEVKLRDHVSFHDGSPFTAVNPNTGGPEGSGRIANIARNVVYMDACRPSRLNLPVVRVAAANSSPVRVDA